MISLAYRATEAKQLAWFCPEILLDNLIALQTHETLDDCFPQHIVKEHHNIIHAAAAAAQKGSTTAIPRPKQEKALFSSVAISKEQCNKWK